MTSSPASTHCSCARRFGHWSRKRRRLRDHAEGESSSNFGGGWPHGAPGAVRRRGVTLDSAGLDSTTSTAEPAAPQTPRIENAATRSKDRFLAAWHSTRLGGLSPRCTRRDSGRAIVELMARLELDRGQSSGGHSSGVRDLREHVEGRGARHARGATHTRPGTLGRKRPGTVGPSESELSRDHRGERPRDTRAARSSSIQMISTPPMRSSTRRYDAGEAATHASGGRGDACFERAIGDARLGRSGRLSSAHDFVVERPSAARLGDAARTSGV